MVQDARLQPFQPLAQVKTTAQLPLRALSRKNNDRILYQGRSRQGERPCCQ